MNSLLESQITVVFHELIREDVENVFCVCYFLVTYKFLIFTDMCNWKSQIINNGYQKLLE